MIDLGIEKEMKKLESEARAGRLKMVETAAKAPIILKQLEEMRADKRKEDIMTV